MSETSCSLCRPYPLLSMRLCFSITKCTDLCRACRNRHGDQTSPVVFCLIVLFSQSQVGDAWGCLGLYCGYLQESLTGITEAPEANSQGLYDFEGPVHQCHRDSWRSWGTRMENKSRMQGQGASRCSVKDLEIRFSILETRRWLEL